MINFERFILYFLQHLTYYLKKYVFGDTTFTRMRKNVSNRSYNVYFDSNWLQCYTKSIRFFTENLNRKFETNAPQAIGKQRMFLKIKLYKNS